MNPTRSTNLRRDEESKSAHNEERNTGTFLRSRTEDEKQRRREQWKLQQERERQHEILKQQKILEYEKKRAEMLKYAKQKSSHHSRSRSSSKSPSHSWQRGKSTTIVSKSNTMFKKLDRSTSGAVPLFKGSEGTQISIAELRRIKVDIRRNIPAQGPVTELKREILDPEAVIVKRRDDEGCKPIFDRVEIKKAEIKTKEVEEQRTVVAVDREQSVSNKSHTSKRRSSSFSPIRNTIRNRSYSPEHQSFDQSRYRKDLKYRDSRADYRDHHKIGGNGIEKRKDYKEKYEERDASKHDRSRSRERDSHSKQFMEERSYRNRYRDRSSERSHERRDREGRDRGRDRNKSTSKERRDLTPHYIEPVHVPIYYSNFARPIVMSPMVPVRGQVPPMGRVRHPTLMGPVRPFSPRFVPPDIYRFGRPPNPRYGPMF